MSSQPSESQDILPRIAAGDAEAVQECLTRYTPLVWALARRFWSDTAGAEDVVQDIFIDIWKSAGRFDPAKASETTFIATIARRRMIDRQRRQSTAPIARPMEEQPIPVEDDNLVAIEVHDEAKQVREALDQLKPEQQRVILLSVVEGLSHPEIAQATGLPLGTVKSHIRRGLSQAAETLRRWRGGEPS
ncbi:MAG: RNA polymerase sigma factor [Planctomycetota bacterium]